MNAILLFLISLGTAYLANRLARRELFTLADLAAGIFGGMISLGIAQFLNVEGAVWGFEFALVVACTLTLGLISLQPRSRLR